MHRIRRLCVFTFEKFVYDVTFTQGKMSHATKAINQGAGETAQK